MKKTLLVLLVLFTTLMPVFSQVAVKIGGVVEVGLDCKAPPPPPPPPPPQHRPPVTHHAPPPPPVVHRVPIVIRPTVRIERTWQRNYNCDDSDIYGKIIDVDLHEQLIVVEKRGKHYEVGVTNGTRICVKGTKLTCDCAACRKKAKQEVPIKLSDLRVGDYVTVELATSGKHGRYAAFITVED